MADERKHDDDEPVRGHSSFRSARAAGGSSLHGAQSMEDIREDDSMDPQPAELPAGTGSGAGRTVGAVAGAVVGAAAGVLGGPVGIAAGAAAGAAIGGAAGGGAGDWADRQDDEDLAAKRLKDGPAGGASPSPQDVLGDDPGNGVPPRRA